MDGINSSVLFMLAMIFTVWSSYRSAPRRIEELRRLAEAERNPPA